MQLSADVIDAMRAEISLEGVLAARKFVRQHLPPTPLMRHPLLVKELGVEVWLKHENHLPTGAFKIRGGLNYMANRAAEVADRGVVTATRGNHGQSIALAGSLYCVPVTIVVPKGNNPEKNAAMRAFGARLIEHGRDFDEAREEVERLVEAEGMEYVHSANEPLLVNGVGTYSLEIAEETVNWDVVVVPLGGGSAICGAITVFRALRPGVRIIGVQAANAPCIYESWKRGERYTTDSADTFADGLATRVPFELPLDILRDGVDDIVLVSEEEIRDAVLLLLRTTHNLAEGAGAAATAAVKKLAPELHGKKVAAVLSGGNIDADTLRWVLG